MAYEYVEINEGTNLISNFKRQLEKHNAKELASHGRTELTDNEFNKVILYLEGGTTFEKAKKLRDVLPLELDNGQRVWLEFLNRQKWCQNEFQVSNQITVEGRRQCRYDVTILINGLPLVQIELKKRGVELKQAYNQVQRYHKTSFHGLFNYIQIFVISNGVNTRYFANNPNSGYKFTFNWTDRKNNPFNQLSLFAAEFFDPCTLGKIISKYIVLHAGDKCLMVLRPYQYYAVEEILDRVVNSNDNGYIWHTTGAGKTLTSFKAAQLVSEVGEIDKVLFVVDRHDLDTQTQAEYEAFEPGAVDGTDNTKELIQRLGSDKKIIITTIQKLNCAVTKDYYNRHLQEVRNKKVVMIFDECHRSHFGESHKNIVRFFNNLQIFGFTGTPIFVENSKNDRTTKEIFGNCLHKYLIKDAIADDNVLGFLVEYYTGNAELDLESESRMREIARFILNNFSKSTFDGEYNALFAVQSVPMLLRYYKIFKELNPDIKIGAIFTYAANGSQDDEATGMNRGFANPKVAADEMQEIIDEYNKTFGTSHSVENFGLYYDDINKRMKKKDPKMKPLDLLLVVGMFLTGFDAKKLNTLYVDKNLEYHGLLQAFSRTNRVLNEKKRFGKVICFRDLKSNVDAGEGGVRIYLFYPNFARIRTAIPSLSEQCKISSFLKLLDERIATQRRLIEDLEKLKSSINETVYATLTTDYQTSFNEIGCDYSGLTGKSAEDFGKGKPFITYLNVYQNQVITDCNFDYVEIGDGEKQNKVQKGDLLFTLSSETPQETGYTAVYMGDDKELYLNSFCFGIHIIESELVYPPYLGYLTSTSYFRRKIIPFAQGSTRFNLHKPSLMSMKFSLPIKENQIKIFNALQLIVKKISTEEEILSNFTYQRNYLLTKLFI